ncbi:MAG: DNA polymerase Y family protein, partial [Chitinophagaceae bacterium]|nr:DNA polymerase Y family protein [Chitinophagaceae bacterium]
KVQNFITMPRSALRRRFGEQLLIRLGQAIGQEIETIEPVVPVVPYQERLPSLDPICTATGIEIAIKDLLAKLCKRLEHEHKGLRSCIFQAFRIDGNIQRLTIGTNSPSRNVMHLFRLFEVKLETIEPALGIELFLLEAPVVEDLPTSQEAFWDGSGKDEKIIAELLDRISCRVGTSAIRRFLPDEHYWPERSVKQAPSLTDKPVTQWRTDMPRPLHLLSVPEMIEVTVPMPDYPPMLFSHKGKLHRIIKADGPERIEQEWWLNEGLYRDYYCVEDDKGARYWLFRSGSYQSTEPKWFVHGFFA